MIDGDLTIKENQAYIEEKIRLMSATIRVSSKEAQRVIDIVQAIAPSMGLGQLAKKIHGMLNLDDYHIYKHPSGPNEYLFVPASADPIGTLIDILLFGKPLYLIDPVTGVVYDIISRNHFIPMTVERAVKELGVVGTELRKTPPMSVAMECFDIYSKVSGLSETLRVVIHKDALTKSFTKHLRDNASTWPDIVVQLCLDSKQRVDCVDLLGYLLQSSLSVQILGWLSEFTPNSDFVTKLNNDGCEFYNRLHRRIHSLENHSQCARYVAAVVGKDLSVEKIERICSPLELLAPENDGIAYFTSEHVHNLDMACYRELWRTGDSEEALKMLNLPK